MASLPKILPHYTIDDWQYWEGKWELHDGFPIAMSPSPIPAHQRVAAEMRTEFVLALRKAKCRTCKAYDPIDYVIAADTIYVPDILIVCGTIAKKFLDFPPSLVVEILSPSTALRDRNTKFQAYQQQGIRHYLLVDVEQRKIEAYGNIEGEYKPRSASDGFELGDGCVIEPDFSAIFDGL